MEKSTTYWNNIIDILLGVVAPAMVGVSVKLAVMMKKEKLTVARVLISYIAGGGTAWLTSPAIKYFLSDSWQSIAIGLIAITGEKIVEFILYKWDIDLLLLTLANAGRMFILNLLNFKK